MLAIIGVLLLITTSASASESASNKINWQLTVKGDFIALARKPVVIDVTDEAKLYGQDKIFEAYKNKGGIVPVEKILQKTTWVNIFYYQSDFIATKWLICSNELKNNDSKNLIELQEGVTPYIEHHFNPALILWMISLFYVLILSAKDKLNPGAPKVITQEWSINTRTLYCIWFLFFASASIINIPSLMPTILLLAFLSNDTYVAPGKKFPILTLITMLASLILVTL